MTGEEAFEIAAAVTAISGLALLLIVCLLAIVGVWKLFRQASEASLASTRMSLSVEELARRLGGQAMPAGPAPEGRPALEGDQFAQLRQQAEALLEQQRRLQEMARDLIDTEAMEPGPAAAAVDDLEAAVNRLDATVGQMATSLANLIQSLERQQEAR